MTCGISGGDCMSFVCAVNATIGESLASGITFIEPSYTGPFVQGMWCLGSRCLASYC